MLKCSAGLSVLKMVYKQSLSKLYQEKHFLSVRELEKELYNENIWSHDLPKSL